MVQSTLFEPFQTCFTAKGCLKEFFYHHYTRHNRYI